MCRHIFKHLGSCTDSCHENVHRFELLISVAHIINTGIFNSDMVFIVILFQQITKSNYMHHDKDVFNLPTAQSVEESIYALAANLFLVI